MNHDLPTRARIAASALPLLFLLTACGGGGGSSSPATPPASTPGPAPTPAPTPTPTPSPAPTPAPTPSPAPTPTPAPSPAPTPTPTPSPAPTPTSDTPDFGPNVTVFDPSTPTATVQAALDAMFNSELLSATAQFGSQPHAFLFKPGTYNVTANLVFYESIAGLGQNPDDVTIKGNINVDSGWNLGDQSNATQNFWRSAENLAVQPTGGTTRWAVSQAAPMRRVHIEGGLTMGPSNQGNGQGFSSGGFIADSRVDGGVSTGSQQQWYTRDSNVGQWFDEIGRAHV